MRICVIGAGAMGCLYGGLLARSGVEVTLVDTWAEHVAAIVARGLRLDGITGALTIPVAATTAPAAASADLALIQTDSNATAEAAATARHVLAPEGWALTLQNGVGNLEALREVLGEGRVAGGLSYHSAAVAAPGQVRHTHAGATWLGEIDGRRSARIERLAGLLAGAGFRPEIVADIQGQIWSKFVHNAAINPISALLGLRVGEIPLIPEADALQSRIIEEALAVVRACGVTLADPDPMASIKAFCKTKFNAPSMLQHMEAGKRTEVDALNGALVAYGQKRGIPTPYNQALMWMVKGMEGQRRRLREHGPFDYDALEAEAVAREKAR